MICKIMREDWDIEGGVLDCLQPLVEGLQGSKDVLQALNFEYVTDGEAFL